MERVFLSVAVVFGAYVVSAFVAGPDWGQVGRRSALIGSLEPNALLLMVATVGTTVTPYMFFYLQSSVADKGLGPEELPYERADAVLGGIWTNAIALFIVIVTAVTIFPRGIAIESAEQAAIALAPVAGDFAKGLFAFGLFGASVLAATVMPLTSATPCANRSAGSRASPQVREAPAFMGLHGAHPDRRRGRAHPGTAADRRHPGQPEPERDPAADHPGLLMLRLVISGSWGTRAG